METEGGTVLKVSKDNSKDVYVSHNLAAQSVVQEPATLASLQNISEVLTPRATPDLLNHNLEF